MNKAYLGELEQMVLLAALQLREQAYAPDIGREFLWVPVETPLDVVSPTRIEKRPIAPRHTGNSHKSCRKHRSPNRAAIFGLT